MALLKDNLYLNGVDFGGDFSQSADGSVDPAHLLQQHGSVSISEFLDGIQGGHHARHL
jgi:hypothetical protein